jgi:hypothetical protein
VLDVFALTNLARQVRQVLQSWTQGPLTAGLAIRHRDGSGLSAQEQYRLNIIRDTLYVVSSVGLLVYGPTYAAQLIEAAIPVVVSLSDAALVAAATLLASGINELVDGINPDLAKVIFRGVYGDEFMLQPDTQTNPGADPKHFLDHTAARVIAIGPADVMAAVAAALRSNGFDGPAWSVAVVGVLLNGVFGAMRSRALSYLRTTESIAENGTRIPDGLLTFVVSGVGNLAGAVRGAVWQPPPLLPTTRPDELLEVVVDDSADSSPNLRINEFRHASDDNSVELIEEISEADPADPSQLSEVVVDDADGAMSRSGSTRTPTGTPRTEKDPADPDRDVTRSD